MLLAFAPFIAFALVDRLVGSVAGLTAGALVAAALLIRDSATAGRSPKVLEIGTLILFGGLALYAVVLVPAWSIIGVRLRVDAGLLVVVLASMALGRPFTIQYAREMTTSDVWQTSAFRRTNYVVTGAWAVAFLVMVVADLVMLYRPDVPLRVGIFATVAALYGAFKFTKWYPKQAASKVVA